MAKTTFSADELACLDNSIKKLCQDASLLQYLVQNGGVKDDTASASVSILEHEVIEIGKILDYDSILAKEVDRRVADLRQANQTIRELKEQMGSQRPLNGFQEQVQHLFTTIREWWEVQGFNYIPEMTVTEYGIQVNFGFSLERIINHFSKTPVTDKVKEKDRIDIMIEQGYQLLSADGELSMLDCPENRSLLIDLLEERFPSIRIKSFENRFFVDRDDQFQLQTIKATIRNVRDVVNV